MSGFPYVDPVIYEKNWPKMTPEEKLTGVIAFMGKALRGFIETMEKNLGKEKAKEITVQAWANILTDGLKSFEESLGVKSSKDALAPMKLVTYMEEEMMNMCASRTLEAKPEKAVREILQCPLGDHMRKEDCENILGGLKKCIEDHCPGYTAVLESNYPETHVCRYVFKRA